MERMKTFLKYALWVIGFIILSNFLIEVSLNSSYKAIGRKDDLSEITIYQAEATLVNGRIRGIIKNDSAEQEQEALTGKYLKIDLYSPRQVYLGSQFVEIRKTDENAKVQAFEVFFKLKEVNYYEISIVDKKDIASSELAIVPQELTKPQIILATALALLIVW